METMMPRKQVRLKLDTLKVQSLVMADVTPVRAVTTSQTCPTRCDTEFDCSGQACFTFDINCTSYC